jgi:hypothetical protein
MKATHQPENRLDVETYGEFTSMPKNVICCDVGNTDSMRGAYKSGDCILFEREFPILLNDFVAPMMLTDNPPHVVLLGVEYEWKQIRKAEKFCRVVIVSQISM